VRNRKQTVWTISDLVDLEFFFVQDNRSEEKSLSSRDRELYLAQLKSYDQDRSALLYRWLEFRREGHQADQPSPLPGESIDPILRIFPFVLFVLGSIAGISLSRIVISSGSYINIFFAFLVLVLLPCLFTLILGVFFPLWRYVRRRRPTGKGGEWIISTLLPRLSRLIQRKMKGQKLIIMDQVWGNLRARSSLYSGVMSWFAYRSFQLFGIGFSLGVLGTLVFLGLFTSMSFGWGTTIGLNEALVYRIVDLAATPWEFLGFSHYPNLEQVKASLFASHGNSPAIILQDENLRNLWAKFFLWSVVVYTVLPRLMLLCIATWGSNRAHRRLSFNDAQCESLLRRMQRPQLKTGKEGGPLELCDPGPFPPISQLKLDCFRVLIPAELIKRPRYEHIENEILGEFKVLPLAIDQVSFDETVDANFLTTLSKDSNPAAVMLILESWQPCINATLTYLRKLRQALGTDRLIIVCLIGRENPDHWATPSADQDFNNWRLRLATLGDPYLQLHRWGKPNE
jgi:hypothetical protein